MKKTFLFILSLINYSLSAQNVITYAGKSHDDIDTYYESQSSLNLSESYFSSPSGICVDPTGNMYISEKNKIRLITNNKVHIRAGSLQKPSFSEGYKNGTGTQTTFRNPGGMVSDSKGNIFIADIDNHCIRKVNKFVNLGNGQVVSTFAGANPTVGLPGYGTSGSKDGTGTEARFNKPTDIAIDTDGNLYVTDSDNLTIRKITPTGVVSTLAGKTASEGFNDGTGENAQFGAPWGVAFYNNNSIVVTDPWNTNIRKINIYSGATTTLAGPTSGPDAKQVDGTLAKARFKAPKGITVVNGIIYVADQNTIRAIDELNNSVTTFAGNVNEFDIIDGNGINAAFTELSGLTSDDNGNLFATENSLLVKSNVIRKITINDLAPVAHFKASKTSLLVDEQITLTDLSSGLKPYIRKWEIIPNTYKIINGDLSSETFDLTFDEAGFYDVSLEISNDFGINGKTMKDYLAVSTTGNIQPYSSSDLLQVYPNPVNNLFNIQLDNKIIANDPRLQLFNSSGKKITDLSHSVLIDVSSLSDGIYFITVDSDYINIARKIVIHHK